MDRTVLRAGAGAAMVGAVLGLVFNILHPRATDDLDEVVTELDLVADSGIWLFDHYMLAWAVAFALVGYIAIARSYPDGPGASWGRIALGSAIVGVTVTFATVLVDGPAMKEAADAWDEAGRGTDGAAFATADAVANVSLALFTGLMGSLFGLTPVLFGVTGLASDAYPRWLAYVALVAGILGLVAGSIQYLQGELSLASTYIFTAGSILFTVWLFGMGWLLWRKTIPPTMGP